MDAGAEEVAQAILSRELRYWTDCDWSLSLKLMNSLPRFTWLCFSFFVLMVEMAVAQPAYRSPEVSPEGAVTFRLLAPKAQAVAVKGLRGLEPQPMVKNSDGLWSVTVGPLSPDLYNYTFDVDGAGFTDPMNRRTQEWISQSSMVEVPAKEPLLISRQDVPHGVLHRHVLPSKVRGAEVAMQVYTPPDFDPKAATIYPVLYLLHGTGDEEIAWQVNGRTSFIADNLLARNQMTAAIIVMPNGHPVPYPEPIAAANYRQRNLAAMEQEMLTVVMPYIEAHYPVRRDARGRAIAGLSMGGYHALGIGLGHPDQFGWVGGFSSGLEAANFARDYAAYARAVAEKTPFPQLVWIGCGVRDNGLDPNKSLIAWLEQNKLPYEWNLTPGGHEWPVWRDYLGRYLQKIFR